jgi:hypothetical protein
MSRIQNARKVGPETWPSLSRCAASTIGVARIRLERGQGAEYIRVNSLVRDDYVRSGLFVIVSDT